MRIPLSKVYRAFRELDQFTDEQCQGYVARAMQKRRASMGGFVFAGVFLCPAVFTLSMVATLAGQDAALGSSARIWILRHWLDVPIEYAAKVVPFVAATLVALVLRDVWLRSAIRKELNRSTCPRCEYQLLGLPVQSGQVMCPECGHRTRIDLLGLRPEDLAMPDQPPPSHPPLAP
jgi:hypothetical protein